MSELDAQFNRAVAAYKAGNKHEARELLLDVVEQDERHEQAWLYLSALVTTLDEQQICLENVLAINPDNQRAKKGLEKVNEQIAARDQRAGAGGLSEAAPSQQPQHSPSGESAASPFDSLSWDSIPAPSATDSGAGELSPIGAEFSDTSGDSLIEQSASGGFPSFDSLDPPDESLSTSEQPMEWLNDGPASAPPEDVPPSTSPTSVDWGTGNEPATYGSGQNVGLPSEQQYDEWVKGLNIEASGPGAGLPEMPDIDFAPGQEDQAAFAMDDSGPFGETNYMLDDEPAFPAPSEEPESGAFGGGVAGWDNEAAVEAAPDAPSFAGFEGPETQFDEEAGTAEAGHVFKPDALYGVDADDYAADVTPFDEAAQAGDTAPGQPSDDLSDLDFSFDDLDDAPADTGGGAGGASAAAAAANYARYFAMIPDDIEPKGSVARRVLLWMGILLLVALNALSFGWLLM